MEEPKERNGNGRGRLCVGLLALIGAVYVIVSMLRGGNWGCQSPLPVVSDTTGLDEHDHFAGHPGTYSIELPSLTKGAATGIVYPDIQIILINSWNIPPLATVFRL